MRLSGLKTFNAADALEMARLCELSYFHEADISRLLKGYPEFEFGSSGETQYFVASNDDEVIVTFRGSQTKGDWAIDFDMDLRLVTLFDTRLHVHDGFYKEAVKVFRDIVNMISRHSAMDKKVYLNGHSLGAALAGMTAALFMDTNINFVGAYCFGMPRIGHHMFASEFNKKSKNKLFRVVNHNDMVTRVPFRSLGYSHIGSLVYMDNDHKLHRDASLWYQFLKRFVVEPDGLAGMIIDGVSDHDIAKYISGLAENVK